MFPSMRVSSALVIVSIVQLSCSSRAPSVSVPPGVHPRNNATEANVAPRWAFFNPTFRPKVTVELGASGTLYAGESGRRALLTPDGRCVEAGIPLPSTVSQVLTAADGTLTFLTEAEGVYTATSPLGDYQTRLAPRAPDGVHGALTATGQKAFIVARPDELSRFDGQAWSKLAVYQHPFEPVALNLDGNGRGSLLLSPHWLFATEDDGATWKEVHQASSSVVAPPKPEISLPPSCTARSRDNRGLPAGAGLRIGPYVVSARGPSVAVEPSEAAEQNWQKILGLECTYTDVDGENDDINVACFSRKEIRLGHWNGKRWTLDGRTEPGTRQMVAGPNGWVLVYGNSYTPRVRVHRGEDFSELEPMLDIKSATVDRKNRIAYALVGAGGTKELWATSLKRTHFRRLAKLPFEASSPRLALLPDGAILVYSTYESPTAAEFGADGTLRRFFSPPLARIFAFSSKRALGLTKNRALAESADAGATWTEVPGHLDPYYCSEVGCLSQTQLRIGWQLPEGAKGQLVSKDGPPEVRVTPQPPQAVPAEPLSYDCQPEGPKIPVHPDVVFTGEDPGAFAPFSAFWTGIDLGNDTHWAHFQTSQRGDVQVVFARAGNGVRRMALLGPNPPKLNCVTDSIFDPLGLIAIRYCHEGPINPDEPSVAGDARLEVGWFDAGRQKVFRGDLSRVHFDVLPRYRRNDSFPLPHATTSLGEPGLFVQPLESRGAWRFHQDGTVDSVELPVASATQSDSSSVSVPDAVTNGSQHLLRTANATAIIHADQWLFPVDPESPEPSHSPVKLIPSLRTERYEACKPQELAGFPLRREPDDDGPVAPIVHLTDTDFGKPQLGLRVGKDGRTCLAAALFQSSTSAVVLVAHEPAQSWLIVPDFDSMTNAVRRLRCVVHRDRGNESLPSTTKHR